jgi:thioredoxin reductase (NADPH)
MTDSTAKTPATPNEVFDLLVVGSGPSGLSCAIEAQKAGLRAVVVDKGCICNSLFHYPSRMTFFTTPEQLELGGIPFPCAHTKPTRDEALQYYRHAAAYFHLDVRQYLRVERVTGADGAFTAHTLDRFNRPGAIQARKLALAIGYFDRPNILHIPGENLGKVYHYYNDPHPYFGMDVVVIGGKNSAAIAALELWRGGARVTLVHRDAELHQHVKYWIKPDIENRIKAGEIKAYFNSQVVEITPDTAVIETPQGRVSIKNDFVFAMIGYHPDFEFLESLGVRFEGKDHLPVCNPETLESNVPGVYLAGVILGGTLTNEIFIENGRCHGCQIAKAIAGK